MVNKVQAASWLANLPSTTQDEIRESMHKIAYAFVDDRGASPNFIPGGDISQSPFVRNLWFSYLTEIEFKGTPSAQITLPTGAEEFTLGMRFAAHLENFALMMRSPSPTSLNLLFSSYLASGMSGSDLEVAGGLTADAVLEATQSLPFSEIAGEYAADIVDIDAETIDSIITALSQISEEGKAANLGVEKLRDSVNKIEQRDNADRLLITLFDTIADDVRLPGEVSGLAFNFAAAIEHRGKNSSTDATLNALVNMLAQKYDMILMSNIAKELASALGNVEAETIRSIIVSLSQISEEGFVADFGARALADSMGKIMKSDPSGNTLTTLFETLALETRLPDEILVVAGQIETALLNRGESSAVDAALHALEMEPKAAATEESVTIQTVHKLGHDEVEEIATSIATRVDGVDHSDVRVFIASLHTASEGTPLGAGFNTLMEQRYIMLLSSDADTTPYDIAVALIAIDKRISEPIRNQAKEFLKRGHKDLQTLLSKAKPVKDPEGGSSGNGGTTPPANGSPNGSPQGGPRGSNLASAADMTSDGFSGFIATETNIPHWGAQHMLESDQYPMGLGITTMTGGKVFIVPITLPRVAPAATPVP